MTDYFKLFGRIASLPIIPRMIVFSLAGLLIVVLTMSVVQPAAGEDTQPESTAKSTANVSSANNSISPLLFGTNLSFMNGHDQILTSEKAQKVLTQTHIQVIRMPTYTNLPEATNIQAAQAVKSMGIVPLIVLQGSMDHDAMSDDMRIVNDMTKTFGKKTVYYEFGNEEDLFNVTPEEYTASWNEVIPRLKQIDPHAHFVGPVTYHYDKAFLTTFLKRARPRPDEISWHEYTCVDTDSNDTCLARIDDWNGHITDAHATMKAILNKQLPIMISEWSYAPNTSSNSNSGKTSSNSKSNNKAFMSTWTQKAFQTLANNHIFASMQYFGNTPNTLVDKHDNLTAQGEMFKAQYDHFVSQAKHPASTDQTADVDVTPVLPTPTPTPMPTATPTEIVASDQSPSTATSASSTSLPAPTPAPTATPVPTPTPMPTPTPVPTATPTSVPTATPTPVPTPTPTPVPPKPKPVPPPPTVNVSIWHAGVNVRSASGACGTAPSRNCAVVDKIYVESTSAVCSATGETVTDLGHTNNWWTYLRGHSGGWGWVNNIYIKGGHKIAGVPDCHGAPTHP